MINFIVCDDEKEIVEKVKKNTDENSIPGKYRI